MNIEKLTEKYRSLPLPLKATIWFTICQFLQKGISFLTTPFIARLLSTEEYGRTSTFASWESIFLIFVTMSSSHAVMNLCVKQRDKSTMFSSLLGYNMLLSSIWGVVLLFTYKIVAKVTGLSYTLIICLFLYCVFNSVIACWTALKQYEYSYKKVVVETLIYTLVSSVGALLAVALISPNAESKIIPQVFCTVVIGIIIGISSFKSSKVLFDKDVWKFTLFFCTPLLPHYFSEIILLCSDRIMIDRMCGSSDVAIYSVAYTVGSLVSMVTVAINSAFAPYQYHKITSREYKTLAKNTNYLIAFVAFCLCGVMLFGREVVLIFGGNKYTESAMLIIPICLGTFFNYLFQLFARIQEYYEQKHTIVIASVSCAVLNIVLNYVFINLYGYKAAAYTTFVCYLSFCCLHYLFYRKVCKRFIGKEIYDIKGLTLISAALIVAALVISFVNELYIIKYIILAISLIIIIWQRKRIFDFIKTMLEK